MPADITIVGLGLTGVQHLTREADEAIRASKEVLYNDTGVATHAFLAERCPVVRALWAGSYRADRGRMGAYRQMAIEVVEAALDHAPVTLAIHGHPVVFVYAPFLIREMASLLGLTVEVQPGISAADAIFAELMIDPGVSGLLQYEATDLLLRQRPLLPDVPLLLWQVGNLETRLHTRRRSRPERLVRLQRALLQAYPPSHPITAVHISPHPLIPSVRRDFALSDLCEQAPLLHVGTTLYLPPAAVRPIADRTLLEQLDSVEHLHRITEL